MTETCKHNVWVIDGQVGMANDDDGYYQQVFATPAEVEAFIATLRAAADEAWGKPA